MGPPSKCIACLGRACWSQRIKHVSSTNSWYAGVKFARQVPVPVLYRTVKIDCSYKLDFLVEDAVVVEIKSVEHLAPVHTAQMITYLKLTGCEVGLIINFNVPLLKDGIRHVEHPDRYWERIATNCRKHRERGENYDEKQRIK